MPRKLKSAAKRFVRRVSRNLSTSCWLWTGGHNDGGYPLFFANGLDVYAHRWAWQQVNGPVPDGLELDHICRNRGCVRPSHLEAVTHLENMRRSPLQNPSHCKHGHPLSGDNLRRRRDTGQRCCRTCERNWKREYKHRQ